MNVGNNSVQRGGSNGIVDACIAERIVGHVCSTRSLQCKVTTAKAENDSLAAVCGSCMGDVTARRVGPTDTKIQGLRTAWNQSECHG
ncbi:hypothetical protein Pelo_19187 [Pelomyxa schiedti]|nr:hypothetical protein Pelo_19187 [Pelomyxa schiedti]